jgi:hypothetical protein
VSTADLEESHDTSEASVDTSEASVGTSRGVGRHVRQRTRPKRWRALFAVVLLAALASAVALVLAQSAGAIHLGFLGPVA